jgi:murein peptide amidase A
VLTVTGTFVAGLVTAAVVSAPIPDLNPDGRAHGTRQNADGVDLNANWSFGWQAGGKPWDFYYGGRYPFSERESRIARNLIERIHPRITIWYHQHMNPVWAWGPSTGAGRLCAHLSGLRFYHHPWLAGTAANWQNHHYPDAASFTVELSAGTLTKGQIAKTGTRRVDAGIALTTHSSS